MNHENMDRLIETIKAAEERGEFDITRFAHNCGSPACLAGYAVILNNPTSEGFARGVLENMTGKASFIDRNSAIKVLFQNLENYLDITTDQSQELAVGFEDVETEGLSCFEPTFDQTLIMLEMFRKDPETTWRQLYEETS